MALFSCPISEVKRSAGGCAVASAAYGARAKLNWQPLDKQTNIRSELTWDYSNLPGLAYSKIHAPEGAPSWVYDREALWNKAEDAEIRCDAQTARKFIIALQVELTLDQNIALLEDIISELVSMGMVVDANIHMDKPHNPHAHLMTTTRELKENRYGDIEFSNLKTREWGSRDFIRSCREMISDKINDHLKLAGFDVRVTHESYKTLGIDLEPTRHEGPARNIKNAELVALNKEVYARNAEKIRANPSLILDKLAINKPVFTKEEIAIEIEKVLSHEIMDMTAISAGLSHPNVQGLESLNNEMSTKYMEIYTQVMTSSELSLVIDEDLKGRTLYTTTKRLEMEQRYVANIEKLHGSDAHRLSLTDADLDQLSFKEEVLERTLEIATALAHTLEEKTGIKFSLPQKNRELSPEQRKAVLNILNGPDIGVIEGIPGAGKTVTMKEMVRQCKKAGKTVIGVTPSSAAALVLAKETGIECKNASLWRKEWLKAKGKKFDVILRGDYYKEDIYKGEGSTNILSGLFVPKGLTKNHVMIIDEASMMELAGMDYLVSEALKVGAKVIKVGDNNQLHAVGWLGAFKKTIEICGSNRLEESRRQQNPLHREATKLLGAYRIRDALKIYMNDGSIVIDKSEGQARGHLLRDYLDNYIEKSKMLGRDDIASIRTQVIATYTNAAANKLNVEVRRSLRDAGIIKGKQYKINVGDKEINLAKGEQIVFTRNYNYLGRDGIYNGEVGTVLFFTKPDRYKHSLVYVMVSKADGSKEGVIIDTKQHMKHGLSRLFDYGYAVTAHKLQGASVDLLFLYLEENMGYEALNVLITRHREFFKMYVNQELLDKVVYESLDKDTDKAKLRFDINAVDGEASKDHILNRLVKLASKRVNSSFASDYVGIGLSDNDKVLVKYIEEVHKAVELIREIGVWQTQEERRTGEKPDLWDHELWEEFRETTKVRNRHALKITENYDAFKDRIIQHSLNYSTIEKHASSKEIDFGKVEEHSSTLNLSKSYILLVEAIDELDIKKSTSAYNAIRSEIVASYAKAENAISTRADLICREDELKSEISAESYFRDVLVSEYLSRIYKASPDDILEKYNSLVQIHGAKAASAMVGNKAKLLGALRGVGIGQLLGLSRIRRDALANSTRLEKSLLSYSRSHEKEKELQMKLEKYNYALQIKKLDEEIEELKSQLPCSLDEKFLDEVGSSITNSEGLKGLKSSSIFNAIKEGIDREEVSLDREMLDREWDQEVGGRVITAKVKDGITKEVKNVVTGEKDSITAEKRDTKGKVKEKSDKIEVQQDNNAPNKKNTGIAYKKQNVPLLTYVDVRKALNSTIIESIFRDFAPRLNPDDPIEKKGSQVFCGSLNINLTKGLWYRFSDGSNGDIFGLVSEALGVKKREALEIVAGYAGVDGMSSATISNSYIKSSKPYQVQTNKGAEEKIAVAPLDAWVPYKALPDDAAIFNPKKDLSYLIKKGGDITAIHEFKDIDGKLAGFTVRVVDSSGRKKVVPIAYCWNEAKQESKWISKGFLTGGFKPIYKAEILGEKPTERVLIVEGEKAADRATKLFPEYAVISWMGGVASTHHVDWSVLAGREVVIWPDCDAPGQMAADSIIGEIDRVNGFNGLAHKVELESLNLEPKWDLGDEIPGHLTDKKLEQVISDTFSTRGKNKLSKALEQTIKESNSQVKALDSLEIMIASGRVDIGDVPSKAIYKATLVAIAVSKGIDLENSKSFVDDVNTLQSEYERMRNIYVQKTYEKRDTNAAVRLTPSDNKNILISELTRDASILHQAMLNVSELPRRHKDLISDVAQRAVSNIHSYNPVEKEQAGSKVYKEIVSEKFVKDLEKQSNVFVAFAKANNTGKKLSNIELSIKPYQDKIEKLENLEYGIDMAILAEELQHVPYVNHQAYITERVKSNIDAYLGDSMQKVNDIMNAKDTAKTIEEVVHILESQHKYRMDVYGNFKELMQDRSEANNKGVEENKDITSQTLKFDESKKVDKVDKSYKTDKTDNMFESKYERFVYGLERAYEDDRKITKAISHIEDTAKKAEESGLLSQEEIVGDMKAASSIKDVYKAASRFSKVVEEKNINERLEGFERDLSKVKQSGDLSSTLKVLENKENYFANLYGTLSDGHEQHIIEKVENAHSSVSENVLDKLQKSITYVQRHNIVTDAQINHALHDSKDIAITERALSRKCVDYSHSTMKPHLETLENGRMVKFEGREFYDTKEYLQHWKTTYEHHLIPIKEINKSLDHIRQREKTHEMGGPSL